MDRRKFVAACGGAMAGAGCTAASEASDLRPSTRRKLAMHLGTQQGPTSPEMLDYFKRHGVEAVSGYPTVTEGRGYWTREDLERTRDLCVTHGLALEMVALPWLTSSHIDREKRGAIVLGQNPDRDRDIEQIQKMIAACAQAGVPAFKYNLSLLGVLRTAATPGRGGSRYSTWKLAEAKATPPLTRAGKVTHDVFWERITYFLERVISVCNEHKVRAACHPHDPGVPPEGFQGADCVLGTSEGLKRFVSIQESPYHGLNFCVGTVAEMLRDPRREIHELIRYFGTRKKIFNVHFRNIRGRRDDFQEVYVDEGDLDMVEVARSLRDLEYPYMVMPDHVPHHPDDPRGLQAFAHASGYIKGVLQAIGRVG
jgi:mannonate dehydratase